MTKEKTLLTEGPIGKRMIAFAIPIFLGNLFQQLYNTADSLIVGNFLGSDALAAVSSSGSLIFLLVGFFNGIAMGAGVAIAKYYGAKDKDSLTKAIHTDLAFAFVAGILLTVIGIIFTPQILKLMGTPDAVLPKSIWYFRIYFAGATAILLYNISVGILQAVGDSKHPLYYLMISSVVNIVLDLLFIGVWGYGVGAAALATTISQGLSAVLCMIQLVKTKEVYQVQLRKIRFHKPMLKEMIQLGLPSGMQNSIISVANIVVQSNINAFGVAAMAGCGAYFKVEGFGFLPITCFSMALTTFIGQNLGAREYDRAKKGARFGVVCSLVLAEFVGISIILFAKPLMGLFTSDPRVLEYGVLQAHTECAFYFLLAFSNCIAGIMRGAGKASVPMFVMLVCWCMIRITYITIAVQIIPKIQMVFLAYPITWSLSSIVFLLYFLKADWVHNFEK